MVLYDWVGPWYESLKVSQKIMGALLILSVLFNGYLLWQCLETQEDLNMRTIALNEAEERIQAFIYEEESEACTLAYIHISGAVNNPGVYALGPDVRLFEALEQAGGTTADADLSDLNLVAKLRDGTRIHIPEIIASGTEAPTTHHTDYITSQLTVSGESELIDLNSATVQELMSLTGIGEVKAQDIINYRETVALFEKIEDITKVSGIGEATYARIKDRIIVQ